MKKLNKILPIALIGTIVPTMTIIPTSCKNDKDTKPITEAKWKAAYAYFDLYNKDANYKIEGNWTSNDKTLFHKYDYEGTFLFEVQGLEKHANITEKNGLIDTKDTWIEKVDCFDAMFKKIGDEYSYPTIYSTSYYYNELWQGFDEIAYTFPLCYDAFVYDKSNDEYSWTMFESEFINLKFTNKFNSDGKISNFSISFNEDIGSEIIKFNGTYTITYGNITVTPFNKDLLPKTSAYLEKSLDATYPLHTPTMTFGVPNDEEFKGPGVAKFVLPETEDEEYNIITLESTDSYKLKTSEVELVLNGEVLTPIIDYTITDTQIKLLNGLKINRACPLSMLWQLDKNITSQFAFKLSLND